MKKARHSDEQIAFALKQAEMGTPVAKVIRANEGFGASHLVLHPDRALHLARPTTIRCQPFVGGEDHFAR